MAAQALNWERDGRHWPHHGASRFVRAAGMSWHVQLMPSPAPAAPVALLLHGTGASTHSWRALMPLLAERCSVVAVDLPAHAFSGMPPAGALSRHFTLPGMAAALGELLRALPVAAPSLIVGHSAGAAVAVRMALDGHAAPQAIVSLNGAFEPLGGLPGRVFSPAAKLAAVLPGLPRLFAWRAGSPSVLRQLVAGTGSVLDAEGVAFYARLAADPRHVAGALAMMANWDLRPLVAELPRLARPGMPRLVLMAGGADRTILPEQAERVHRLLPAASLLRFERLGHLMHEEAPERLAAAIGDALQFCTPSMTMASPPLPAFTGPV